MGLTSFFTLHIARLFRRMNRCVGNLRPMPSVFPDYPAPVVRNAGEAEEMVLMRWGMPPAAADRRAAGEEHPQHAVALTQLAQIGEALPGASE